MSESICEQNQLEKPSRQDMFWWNTMGLLDVWKAM
jgi:hypothetical protein